MVAKSHRDTGHILAMALPGQRFELDLDADDFTANILPSETAPALDSSSFVQDIQERNPDIEPVAPAFKPTSKGFPEHKPRAGLSRFRQKKDRQDQLPADFAHVPPSDRAIAHHVSRKYGYDPEARQKAEISEENKRRIAAMSEEDIAEARAELTKQLSPAFIERLIKRANIDSPPETQGSPSSVFNTQGAATTTTTMTKDEETIPSPDPSHEHPEAHAIHPSPPRSHRTHDSPSTPRQREPQPSTDVSGPAHFPTPPRDPALFVELDENSPNFQQALKETYFPELAHDPSTLDWMSEPSADELAASSYSPSLAKYAPSDLRFSFTGRLVPPKESLTIPVAAGLHHHGQAAASAGYTVPELAILARSALPAQRCLAYLVLGRVLYRLGKGEFAPKTAGGGENGFRGLGGVGDGGGRQGAAAAPAATAGGELAEGLWKVIEKERVIEIMMREANRDTGGHLSARAYATEALWLWRRGRDGVRAGSTAGGAGAPAPGVPAPPPPPSPPAAAAAAAGTSAGTQSGY